MNVNSELLLQAQLGEAIMDIHLVSWQDDTDSTVERYGIYLGNEESGAVVATFVDTAPFEVAMSTMIGLTWANIITGSDRAGHLVESLIVKDHTESPTERNLIL